MTVKILITKTRNNGVDSKVNLGEERKGSFSYRVGTKRSIRMNQGEDRKEYPYLVSYTALDSFLEANNVKEEDVVIDPNSIDDFYVYSTYDGKDRICVNLTPAKVEEWWNYDCPDLYRYIVNKDDHTNFFGMRLVCFQHKLVEATWSATYIGEDIREDEVEKLTNNYPNTTIAKEMRATLQSRDLSETKVELMQKSIDSYEVRLQNVVDEHSDKIKELTIRDYILNIIQSPNHLSKLQEVVDLSDVDFNNPDKNELRNQIMDKIPSHSEYFDKILQILDGSFGLDCGWVNVYTRNSEYNEHKKLLKNTPKRDFKYATDYTNIKVPIFVQSTTIQKAQFEHMKDIIERETREELYAITQLD